MPEISKTEAIWEGAPAKSSAGLVQCNLECGNANGFLLGNSSVRDRRLTGGVCRQGLNDDLRLRFGDDDDVRQRPRRGLRCALDVGRKHDRDVNAEHALLQVDVGDGAVDELVDGVTGLHHVPVLELHDLCSGGTKLAGNDDLDALGAILHDVPQDTVAGTTNGQATQQLVAQRFRLGDGAQGAVLNACGEQLDVARREVVALLDQRRQLANAAALLTEHALRAGRTDDDLGTHGRDTDVDAGVAVLGELLHEEVVQLGVEHAVGHEFTLLADVSARHSGSDPTVSQRSHEHTQVTATGNEQNGERGWSASRTPPRMPRTGAILGRPPYIKCTRRKWCNP
ncbi:hypothetical protein PBRA_003162 [Plasmodiophora brassicae]|uniref:Uncharacterized protein n=1 Tax=Plasmodiophora brassicae TaxID=37360 RepID=A0A0G4J799_PLABS|nr:hypothetical protein PBRA_003162 [Plasmodiophora brassicae]